MKSQRLLAVAIAALILVSALPMQQAFAQGAYSEKLNVYIAGADALWFFTFNGISGSSHLSTLEATPGLSWYNVTAINTAKWPSDFQVFGPQGYDLTGSALGLPFIPSQGMFLTLGANSFANASSAAAAIDSYLLTDFVSLTNGTGVYTFYSPVSFSDLVPATLLKLIPSADGGFAAAISASTFTSTNSPFVVLEGVRSQGGFDHALVVGSISPSALTSTLSPNIMGYFGSGAKILKASNESSSSVIRIDTLDGVMTSTDHAVLNNAGSRFTGSYTLDLAPGKSLFGINATVVEQPAPLLATRAADVGVIKSGGDIAVTLTFKNLSPQDTITQLSFADNWWNNTGAFKFLSGDYATSTSLKPGATVTPVYRLQYTGNGSGPFTIPASVVKYQYKVGSTTFNATSTLNPIRLSLGTGDAVVYAVMTPVGAVGKAVGANQSMEVSVVNIGNLPASSVVVAGQPIPGLAANGGAYNVTVTQSASGITGVNLTKPYYVAYQDPAGNELNATTNIFSNVFSHTSMQIGFPVLSVGASLSPLPRGMNLTLNFLLTNPAPAQVTSFRATGILPRSIGCGRASGAGISCSDGQVTISYGTVNATTLKSYLVYNLTSANNFVLAPLTFVARSSGAALSGRSDPVAVPAGLQLTKQFTPVQAFGGMTSLVTVSAANQGTAPFYNASVKTTADTFDSVLNATALATSVQTIGENGIATFSYRVLMSQVYGNLSGTPATATFYYGGTSFSVVSGVPRVQVYKPLTVAINTKPSTPEEGKSFAISVVITNPSDVSVSNVSFTLPIPTGLGLSNPQNLQASPRLITVTVQSLGPHASVYANATAVASSGTTVSFANAKLTFVYQGIALKGVVPKASGIAIAENVFTRYIVPTAFVLLVMLGVAYYLKRMGATVPSSRK